MRRLSYTAAVLVAMLSVSAVSTVQPPAASIAEQVSACYVELRSPDGTECYGSGTVITHDGRQLVLTAKHVADYYYEAAEAARYNTVTLQRGNDTWHGDVIAVSGNADLAVIRPRCVLPMPSMTFTGEEVIKPGDTVHYTSNPCGCHGLYERSIIHATNYPHDGRDFAVIGGLIWFGTSGAGVCVERNGRPVLVGVAIAILWRDGKAPGIAESQPTITAFLKGIQ